MQPEPRLSAASAGNCDAADGPRRYLMRNAKSCSSEPAIHGTCAPPLAPLPPTPRPGTWPSFADAFRIGRLVPVAQRPPRCLEMLARGRAELLSESSVPPRTPSSACRGANGPRQPACGLPRSSARSMPRHAGGNGFFPAPVIADRALRFSDSMRRRCGVSHPRSLSARAWPSRIPELRRPVSWRGHL